MGTDALEISERLLISGGTLINSDSTLKADIAVSGGVIEAIGKLKPADYEGYRLINANGKYVIPGGIDPHVHLNLPTPAGNSSDDFVTGSIAALSGGTTSIIDFVTPKRGESLVLAMQKRRAEARQSHCNWKLHLGISEWNQKVKEELLYLIKFEEIKSIKVYLAYKESIGISFAELEELMELVVAFGVTVLVHCEDGDKIEKLKQLLIREGKTNAFYHGFSRPPDAEIEAIQKVINLSEQTGCSVYIVHTSTAQGAILIREAKAKGLNIHGETCIQYLILDDEVYDDSLPNSEVLPFIISPPFRSKEDQQLLWRELANGAFDTVATDHCPFNLLDQKDKGMENFTLTPNGAGGIEYRLSLLYTYGVLSCFITLEQFVNLTSTRAAELFGWGDKKGRLKPGYDADIVIWNPDTPNIITIKQQMQRCDSNIYEGIPVKGKAEWVICNGSLTAY